MLKIGDKVVCIQGCDSATGTLKEGNMYIVQGFQSPCCGKSQVNVGALLINPEGEYVCVCGYTLAEKGQPNIWFAPEIFRKIIEQPRVIRIQMEENEPILS